MSNEVTWRPCILGDLELFIDANYKGFYMRVEENNFGCRILVTQDVHNIICETRMFCSREKACEIAIELADSLKKHDRFIS